MANSIWKCCTEAGECVPRVPQRMCLATQYWLLLIPQGGKTTLRVKNTFNTYSVSQPLPVSVFAFVTVQEWGVGFTRRLNRGAFKIEFMISNTTKKQICSAAQSSIVLKRTLSASYRLLLLKRKFLVP